MRVCYGCQRAMPAARCSHVPTLPGQLSPPADNTARMLTQGYQCQNYCSNILEKTL